MWGLIFSQLQVEIVLITDVLEQGGTNLLFWGSSYPFCESAVEKAR
jgi:hypothetical protein